MSPSGPRQACTKFVSRTAPPQDPGAGCNQDAAAPANTAPTEGDLVRYACLSLKNALPGEKSGCSAPWVDWRSWNTWVAVFLDGATNKAASEVNVQPMGAPAAVKG